MGGKFSLPCTVNKRLTIHETIKDIECIKSKNLSGFVPKIRNTIIPKFHKFLHHNHKFNPIDDRITKMYKATKLFQKDNPNILFTRADKGNVMVALDKEVYTQKTEELLLDENTYCVVKNNPEKVIEKRLNNLVKLWEKKEYISKEQSFHLRSSDATLPKAYALPKIHKENILYRIIVSSVNTALYSFAKFLKRILSDNIPKARGHINNSFELYNRLSGVILEDSDVLVSLDATSLFTNIPLDLAILGIEKKCGSILRILHRYQKQNL